ncbi:Baseplate J family protein [Candidatus Glomeribacter gigasporarum BEG34]|uniref:Baseplate J family protein n=1 Tax=Candidatus Glomeribacter gigasporarum BEG34 TaxID=1070319 RepID=G2JBV8_9BURK|nr:baseplate J/gp47 family protein [Candidatus Glomeribacter gigasporarum]CCD30264.1 Baseplate J family protein [Candidatus Glomeribacter gigasporarum BEG34]
MPYTRPTLTELRQQVAQDLGVDALLRFSNLRIVGDAQAALAHLHYGYLDWIARQGVPFTAEDEYLEGWAALKGVYRKPAQAAAGRVTFTGAPGAVIPKGAPLVRSDGMTFTTQTSALVDAEGTATVEVQAESDPAGLSGAAGNTPVGTPMTLGTAIAGVQSNGLVHTPLTGGTDLESDDSLRRRMLAAYQQPPQGGSQTDYVQWALQVEGVTRAWCAPQGFGIGTVVVYIMCDQSQAEQAGFPQGEDGVAQDEPRGVAASGDQLRVANHLYVLQPVTALVYVVSPLAHRVDVEISGLPNAAPEIREAIAAAIRAVFSREGQPGRPVYLSSIESAIAAIAGTAGFIIQSPVGNIANGPGQLPVLGEVRYL